MLKIYSEGGSIKSAFEEVGVDRNTNARIVIAELYNILFFLVGQWNETSVKLFSFVDRFCAAITTEIEQHISKMNFLQTTLSTSFSL